MVQAHPAAMSAEHHTGFFQRKSVQTLLPFVTSLALHAGLIAVCLSVYQAVKVITVVKTEVGLPVDGTIDPIGPIPVLDTNSILQVKGKDPTRDPLQDIDPENTDPKSMKFTPGKAAMFNPDPGGAEGENARMLDAFGSNIGGGGRGRGAGSGFGDGDGESQDGILGRFGPPGGGPETIMPPARAGARKIVYVCDATGSMTPVFSGLRMELGKEINRLRQTQYFNVIFFSDDKVLNFSQQLVRADESGKKKAADYFNSVVSRGQTNPIPAIRAAFAQQPDVIYVLTDGFDQVNDLQSVVKEFDTLNKDRKVQVHTILIGSGEQKELVEVLKTIAKQNNGTPKIVSKEDF